MRCRRVRRQLTRLHRSWQELKPSAITGDLEVGLDIAFDEQIVPEGMGFAVGNIAGLTLQKTPIVVPRIWRLCKSVPQSEDGGC